MQLIHILHPHSLSKYGYSLSKTSNKRRIALLKALHKFGYSSVMKKVNALYVFNKNLHPITAKKASSDKKWLKSFKLHSL